MDLRACTARARPAPFEPARRGRLVRGLRDVLVGPLRLEPALGTRDEVFPVLRRSPERVVLGLDDRHLDLRVLVDVQAGQVRCTTGLRRRPLGRAHFAVVGPFHRRTVPGMPPCAARRGWTSGG